MPIYEFRCRECNEYFELLVMKEGEVEECPKCRSKEFERIMSTTNISVNSGAGNNTGPSTQTRNCSSGSCTTYQIPGPKD